MSQRRRNKEYLPDSKFIVALIRDHTVIHSALLMRLAIKEMSIRKFKYATKMLKQQRLLVEGRDFEDGRSKFYRVIDEHELRDRIPTYSEREKNDVMEILA